MDKYVVAALFEFVFVVALMTLVICFLFSQAASYSCKEQWPQKYKPEFGFFSGCTIEHNGERIPAANFRAF